MLRSVLALALVATLLALPSRAEDVGTLGSADHSAAPHAVPDLRKMLMEEFSTMNAKNEGIFHHDITPTVSAYFPVGQPIADTKKIISAQKLGTLKPFKGTNDPGMGSMFVAKFDLMDHMFSNVYVVLDFDFDGIAPNLKLKQMKAYLRASNM